MLFVESVSMSGSVLTPLAVLAGVLGAWRLGADAGWTSDFFIADGLLSRYQLWFAIAIGAQTSALILDRWVADQNTHDRSQLGRVMASNGFDACHKPGHASYVAAAIRETLTAGGHLTIYRYLYQTVALRIRAANSAK